MKRLLPGKPIIVIGEKEDAHLPFVERHLSEPLVVIDMAAMMADEALSYSFYKGKLRIVHKDQPLDNIAGVWLRQRRIAPNLTIPVSPQYQRYARSALLRHTEALYAHLEKVRWVSNYYAMRRAGYKPLQLQVAARLGLKIPDTLFTSSPTQAKMFIDNRLETITKPISIESMARNKKDYNLTFFATKIRRGERIDLSGLPLAPAIFQQAIDAVADLRITVIGDKIFPVIIVDKKIDSSSPVRDWRVGQIKGKLHIEPYQISNDIADKCIALVKELGLEFGAIDLLLDTEGEIWFLEINPNGQWAFVEEATGQPIGKALADLLQNKT